MALKVLPLALAATLLKYGVHALDLEVISLNPLFSGLLAATVFLIGFLISGVLTDYKESERLPGELAVSLEAIFDEGTIVRRGKGRQEGSALLREVQGIARSIQEWLYGRETFGQVMTGVTRLNDHFLALEAVTLPPFITRMKQEQTALRRVLTRVRTIKETSFVVSAYTIAEIMSVLLIIGFLLAKIDPFHESVFFVGLITFLFAYMLRLIKDLDDPFEYREGSRDADEVSLKPLQELEARMQSWFEGDLTP
jgi:hypothetical protein